MKSQTLLTITLVLLILGIALFTFSMRNQEPAQTFSATVNRDCAPWDGAAFTLSVPLKDGNAISISIWQTPAIKSPVAFSFPDNTGQVGNATLILANENYEALTGDVRFEGVGEGMPIEGRYNFTSEGGEQLIGRFKAEWGSQIMLCG